MSLASFLQGRLSTKRVALCWIISILLMLLPLLCEKSGAILLGLVLVGLMVGRQAGSQTK